MGHTKNRKGNDSNGGSTHSMNTVQKTMSMSNTQWTKNEVTIEFKEQYRVDVSLCHKMSSGNML